MTPFAGVLFVVSRQARASLFTLYPYITCRSSLGGAIHGLAKESTLYAVKVLGPDGLGSITSLLAGMNEV